MALNKAEIDKLKKQLDELNKIYSKIGEKPITIDIGKATIDDLKLVNEYLSDAKILLDDLDGGFSGIARSIKNIVDEWKPGFADPTKDATKSFTKLKGIAEKLSDDITNITVLNKKQLSQSVEQIKSEQKRLNTLKEELKVKDELSTAEAALLANLESEYDVTEDLLKQANSRLNVEKQIEKTLGLTGAGFKALEHTLGKIGIESEHFHDMNEQLREAAKTGSGLNVVAAGFKGITKGIGSSLKDPAIQLGIAGGILHTMVEAGMEFNHETNKIQKNLGLSKTAAAEMNTELEHMAMHSKGVAMNHSDLVEANTELNASLGTSVVYSAKQLQDNIKLKDVAGLEADEREGILKFSMLTGKSQEQVYDSIGKQNKGVLSNKKVLSEVLKTSGQLAAQYKNNPELLGKAVTQAQKLGMTLEQTKKISQGLLNFEDSISAELEAELLTGQDLNLEKARYLALQGDSAGAAEEMMKNLGPNGLQKFQKMNTIQQESYAKALGMSADELADSLVKQKQLDSLGKEEAATLKKRVAELKANGETEKAAELEKQALAGKSVTLAEQELSIKEKLDKSMASIKSSFTGLVAGPIASTLESFSGILEKIAGNPVGKMIVGFAGGAAALGALILGTIAAVKTVKSLLGKGPADRTAKATEEINRKMGSGGSLGGGSGTDIGGGSKKGKKRGRFSKMLGGLGSAMGMASMFGGGGEGEEVGGAMEGMTDVADVASSSGGGGTTKAASTARKAAKGGGLLGKIGGFFGGIGKKVMGGLGSVKKIFSGPLAKGFGKALGPILSIVESVGSAASLISDARERKAAGEKIDVGSLGKSLVQAAAYPIVNASMNLIPGFGTALSIGDGILSSFGLSPIKFVTDNLVDLVPNDAFSGLGNLAVGEKAMAKGGIVTGPTRALVGEAGNEAVIPLTQFYAKLDELIAVVKQGGYVYLDGNKVGTAMAMGTFKTQ
jgi:hypothetical protein